MKVYELVKLMNAPLLMMREKNVGISMVNYLGMFDEYCAMMGEKLKKEYIIAVLCERYGIGRTRFRELINGFEGEI